jgi:hypothetical protein
MAELSSVQCINRAVFNPASLTGTYASINGTGFSDDVKILEIFNGGTVGVDISLDGVNDHLYWPPGATIIVDFQTNHSDNSAYGAGTLNGRKGQIIYGKTTENEALIFISGYR